MKSVVFCTTCKNRYQHLGRTLAANLPHNTWATTKFVVVNYNSGDDMSERIKADHMADIDSGRLIYARYYGDHPFRMAHAKNMAHRIGLAIGGNILVNLDADNFTGQDFDQYILEQMEETENRFLYADMIKGVLPKGISGRIICTRDQFLLSGGYDEKYETYSPDDKDFKARLIRLGFQGQSIDVKHLDAIRHTDKMRFKEYPHAAEADAEDFQIDPNNRVVNYGKIGCGEISINFDTMVELVPLPTRVFGIGMHKTATTSLHHAFQMLGLKSAHWNNAHWAKAIWDQMTNEGRSLSLEQYYALCDMPIPTLYKELDAAYPNSKFVLTVRPEADWIESVRKHWDIDTNPQRKYWDTDPFTHFIHKQTYGQKGFNAELFLSKYRQHNAEVKEYFKQRPDQLFVMEKTEWNGLCRFLDLTIPQGPYPSRNVSPKGHVYDYSI